MLEVIEERSTPTCVVARLGDKVTGDEYEDFLPAIDSAIREGGGHASAVFILESSPSYGDARAAESDFSFGTHQYRRMSRVAFVGDVKWVDSTVRALGWLTRAEERAFASSELDEAIGWASEQGTA